MFKFNYFFVLLLKLLFLLSLGYLSGLFTYVNNYFYHYTFPHISSPHNDHKAFTLVDASDLNSTELLRLIERISAQKPKQIIADIFHHNLLPNNRLKEIIKSSSKIKFILPIVTDNEENAEYFGRYSDSLSLLQAQKSKIAFYPLNALYQEAFPQSQSYPSLEALVVKHPKIYAFFENDYTNYNGNPSFAKIYASTILDGRSLSSFIAKKTVIVSTIDNRYVRSPYHSAFGEKFLHQTHLAFVLKGFITDTTLSTFRPWQYFLFFTLWILLLMFLSFRFSEAYLWTMFILAILMPLVSYWIALRYFNFLLPLNAMTFVSLATTFFLINHARQLKEEEEESILSHMSKRLQDKVTYQTFYNSATYWKELISFVDQLLPIKKTILFEKLPNDTRIKEVASQYCDFQEIEELRRDYTRDPYALAIKNKTITVPNRPFFLKEEGSDELEFIVPLLYHNQVIGFWAILFERNAYEQIHNAKFIINNLAKEIAELLFQRLQFHQAKVAPQYLKRLFSMQVKDSNIHSFKRNFAIIEKRMLLNETIFDSIHSNIISYNLFGQIIQINQGMNALFEEEEVSTYTLNASSMLSTFTNIEVEQGKKMVREVTFGHQEHQQFVTLKKSQKRFLLIISPLTREDIDNKFAGNYLFQTFGLLFSFIDFSFVEEISHLRQEVGLVSLQQFQKRLMSFEQSFGLLEANFSKPTLQQRLIEQLKQKIEKMDFTYHQLETLMHKNLSDTQDDLYPMQILHPLTHALDYVLDKYKSKQLKVTFEKTPHLPLVLVSVNSIQQYLRVLFDFLAEDCEEQGNLFVEIEERPLVLEIVLKSDGYGMPNEQLQKYLHSLSTQTETYQVLSTIKEHCASWDAKIDFSSHLGEGIAIVLTLKIVHL